jgi:hypothetical protein
MATLGNSDKQQTAVDWVFHKLLDIETGELGKIEIKMGFDEFKELFMNGNEMHKHQVVDAIVNTQKEYIIQAECYPPQFVLDKAFDYYEENFKF